MQRRELVIVIAVLAGLLALAVGTMVVAGVLYLTLRARPAPEPGPSPSAAPVTRTVTPEAPERPSADHEPSAAEEPAPAPGADPAETVRKYYAACAAGRRDEAAACWSIGMSDIAYDAGEGMQSTLAEVIASDSQLDAEALSTFTLKTRAYKGVTATVAELEGGQTNRLFELMQGESGWRIKRITVPDEQ